MWVVGTSKFFSSSPSRPRIALEKGSGWEGERILREKNGRELYTRVSLSLTRVQSEVYGTSCKAHAPGERYNSRWSSQLLDSWTDILAPSYIPTRVRDARDKASRAAVTPGPRNATRVMSPPVNANYACAYALRRNAVSPLGLVVVVVAIVSLAIIRD